MRLLLVLPYMIVFIGLATADQDSWEYCFDTGNFTANSSYARNHKLLLSILASNITLSRGFYNTSTGQDPDKVYGLALCRGDLSSEDCGRCVNSTSQEIMTACPSQNEALMWDTTNSPCLVRYAERSFFGKLEMDVPINANYYGEIMTSNLSEFEQIWQPLMDSTAEKASMGSSRLKFATQEAKFTIYTIYAMMQCTPDLSPTDCKLCLTRGVDEYKKCCRGRQGGRVESANCMLRFDLSPFYVPQSPSLPPTPSTIVEGKGGITTPTVVVIVSSMIIFMVLVSVACFFLGRLKRKQMRNNQGRRYNADEIEPEEAVQFDLSTIMVATNHFSDDRKLGQGGFGIVYKGTLPNGQDIAVKKSFINSGQGETEFKNEVLLVARLQHRNLVRLMGFCCERNERLLIYEYVPNSSLDSFIFDPIKRTLMDWERRYKIIMGVARGILYLHEDSRLRIVHRDLKASNILLNEDMDPKISDFGIARMFEIDQSQGDTSRIAGTFGYMAPEYIRQGHFSVKSDVFSFGVLILEIIAGQKNSCFHIEEAEDLLSYAWRSWREGTTLNLIDPILRDGSIIEMMRCIHIGLLCVQANVADRPTMPLVVLMLASSSISLPLPTKPGFFVHTTTELDNSQSDQSNNHSVKLSVNDTSITDLDPR